MTAERPTSASLAPLPTELPGDGASGRVRRLSPVLPPPLAIVEMAILLAVVLAEYFWEGFPAISRINPHPYWIAILLLSLQYGTVSGLITASIAIIGSVLIGLPEPDIEERYFSYLIRVWTQPLLWLFVAMVLGSFRARQIEQREDLLRSIGELRARGATLVGYSEQLRARVTMLERRLATRAGGDGGGVLGAVARLGEAAPGRWTQALAAVLESAYPGGQFSLYSLDASGVRLMLTHGQQDNTSGLAPAALEMGHPLVTAIASGRSLSVLDEADDDALVRLGVAAVPVFGEDGRQVIGMLKADRLRPAQIDATTLRGLSVVASQLAPVLQRGPVSIIGGSLQVDEMPRDSEARSGALGDSIPLVRHWRKLKWLSGGKTVRPSPTDGGDG